MAKSIGHVHNLMFRALVAEMTKFPLSSALAGSELVHMVLSDGVLLAHSGSLVRSKAQVRADGSFDWISVDVRFLEPFASLVQSRVTITVDEAGKLIKFNAGDRELSVPYASGSPYEKPRGARAKMTDSLSDEDAEKLNYLADIASEDDSRPDLNCVAVAPMGKPAMHGIAANQRSTAVVILPSFDQQGFIPVPVARVLKKGDSLAQVGSAQGQAAVSLKSKVGIHTAPLIDKNRDFPVAQVSQFISSPRTLAGTASGDDFLKSFSNCKDCLGFITKTGAYVELNFFAYRLEFNAQNGGGARFRTKIEAEAKKEVQLFLPLDEVVNASKLFADKRMEFSLGKNNEVFMTAQGVIVVVAPWNK